MHHRQLDKMLKIKNASTWFIGPWWYVDMYLIEHIFENDMAFLPISKLFDITVY